MPKLIAAFRAAAGMTTTSLFLLDFPRRRMFSALFYNQILPADIRPILAYNIDARTYVCVMG